MKIFNSPLIYGLYKSITVRRKLSFETIHSIKILHYQSDDMITESGVVLEDSSKVHITDFLFIVVDIFFKIWKIVPKWVDKYTPPPVRVNDYLMKTMDENHLSES